MARLVLSEFLTLDGVMEEPSSWQRGHESPEIGPFKRGELFGSGALLLGRVTYEGFARYWPTATGTGEFGERMNALPKYVASTTLTRADWQNSVVLGTDVAGEVAALKARLDGDLLMYGSGVLGRFLLARGLVDGLNLIVYPLTLGVGKRLFTDTPLGLTLLDSRAFSSGAVLLRYAPAAK